MKSIRPDTNMERILKKEEKRQQESLNLIASENFTPRAVRELSASVLMHKYAEGYPGRRYYPGTAHYDAIERTAKRRALDLFGLSAKKWHVNVQPYSGAVANIEAYFAALSPGDGILSLSLSSGGHLSHGSKASMTGKLFRIEHYGVDRKYELDYRSIERKAKEFEPKLVVSGASALPGKIDFKKIGTIAHGVGALHLADISHYAGLISARAYPHPFEYADIVMTTTHKSLFGPRGALLFAKRKGTDLAKRMDRAVFPGMQGGPHMHTIAGISAGLAYAKENGAYFKQAVKNAQALAQALREKKYILHGDTRSHLVLMDVSKKGMHGLQAEQRLEKSGIFANRNAVDGDASVQKPSAIRLGVYALTYRGMREKEMRTVASLIDEAVMKKNFYENVRKKVAKLCSEFPVPEL